MSREEKMTKIIKRAGSNKSEQAGKIPKFFVASMLV